MGGRKEESRRRWVGDREGVGSASAWFAVGCSMRQRTFPWKKELQYSLFFLPCLYDQVQMVHVAALPFQWLRALLSHQGSPTGQAESLKFREGQRHLSPDRQGDCFPGTTITVPPDSTAHSINCTTGGGFPSKACGVHTQAVGEGLDVVGTPAGSGGSAGSVGGWLLFPAMNSSEHIFQCHEFPRISLSW